MPDASSSQRELFQQSDLLNLPAVAGVEVLTRYLAQIEVAVSRNPRASDFADLDAIAGSTVNQHGGLVLPEYSKYVAELQRDEAFTMKQRRQWAEEQDGANMVLTLPPARLLSVAGAVECNPVFEPAASASQIVKGLVAAIEAKEAGAIDMDEDNE